MIIIIIIIFRICKAILSSGGYQLLLLSTILGVLFNILWPCRIFVVFVYFSVALLSTSCRGLCIHCIHHILILTYIYIYQYLLIYNNISLYMNIILIIMYIINIYNKYTHIYIYGPIYIYIYIYIQRLLIFNVLLNISGPCRILQGFVWYVGAFMIIRHVNPIYITQPSHPPSALFSFLALC